MFAAAAFLTQWRLYLPPASGSAIHALSGWLQWAANPCGVPLAHTSASTMWPHAPALTPPVPDTNTSFPQLAVDWGGAGSGGARRGQAAPRIAEDGRPRPVATHLTCPPGYYCPNLSQAPPQVTNAPALKSTPPLRYESHRRGGANGWRASDVPHRSALPDRNGTDPDAAAAADNLHPGGAQRDAAGWLAGWPTIASAQLGFTAVFRPALRNPAPEPGRGPDFSGVHRLYPHNLETMRGYPNISGGQLSRERAVFCAAVGTGSGRRPGTTAEPRLRTCALAVAVAVAVPHCATRGRSAAVRGRTGCGGGGGGGGASCAGPLWAGPAASSAYYCALLR
ncbi:uncharacterized protein LOC126336064 [Schistocerca gregaria]|uniref:uncharacterized protein LOC126336064 n=1 Tax=Schistocerca gregaria TaxID=7010 RepID=UPI00211E069D|nr:uncharacterized protein LOC126336064 [Schistocerca gregaria]